MLSRHVLGFAALVFLTPSLSPAAFNYFNPDDTSQIPLLLSQTGAYASIANNVITPEAVYFDVNAPLWSDDAHKERWILLPPGKFLLYSDTADFFSYPESTVFIKTFSQERVQDNPATSFRWETRILIRQRDAMDNVLKWRGISYKWRADQSDADLVSRDEFRGLDTAFSYTGGDGVLTYKKWRYPSKSECATCHRNGFQGVGVPDTVTFQFPDTIHSRAVLGFFPVQLKRQAPYTALGAPNTDPSYNQIHYLIDRGVFWYPGRPPAEWLNQRWMGVREPLPPVTDPENRFKTLDTMARSYIASNCSGCHGHRGIATNAIQGYEKNWDYYRLNPYVAFEDVSTGTYGINDTTTDTTTVGQKIGRQYYKLSIQHAGLDMSPGQPWDMALPPGVDPITLLITAVYPGYPALSEILYRQVARNTPWNDSDKVYRDYIVKANRICSTITNPTSKARCIADSTRAAGRLTWLFSDRWGSQPWLTALNTRGYPLDSALAWAGGQYPHGEQMPPLATYLPDTAALKVMGEWIQRYGNALTNGWVPVGIKAPKHLRQARIGSPQIRNQMLILPAGMAGKVQMMAINGRLLKLQSAGGRMYMLPARLPKGIYYVKVGKNAFRVPVM